MLCCHQNNFILTVNRLSLKAERMRENPRSKSVANWTNVQNYTGYKFAYLTPHGFISTKK